MERGGHLLVLPNDIMALLVPFAPLFSSRVWRHMRTDYFVEHALAQEQFVGVREQALAHVGLQLGDDSPSLKGRGFYGLAPRLCRPTAMRVMAFHTREGAYAALAWRTSTLIHGTCVLFPVGPLDHGTPQHESVGKGQTPPVAQ